MALIGNWIHFTTEHPYTLGYFKYLPTRERLDVKPLICDTTGLIIASDFYFIDSSGKINPYPDYEILFAEECEGYARTSDVPYSP